MANEKERWANGIIPSPCTPECAKRSEHCRQDCNKHKAYELFKKKQYKERHKLQEQNNISHEHRVNFSEKFRKSMGRNGRAI